MYLIYIESHNDLKFEINQIIQINLSLQKYTTYELGMFYTLPIGPGIWRPGCFRLIEFVDFESLTFL